MKAHKRKKKDALKHDPIEDDPQTRPVIDKAEREAELELAGITQGMGFCHEFWGTKQRILREKYGVIWRTPAEMNPDVIFD